MITAFITYQMIIEIVGYTLMILYGLSLLVITIYCMMQFHLLYYYKRFKHRFFAEDDSRSIVEDSDLPYVTIQLPIYNEKYVIDRLLDSIAKLDYPKSKYEIHILDDSTDETVEIVKKAVARYREMGFNISQVTRPTRTGYKAGALKEAMHEAMGEFIAIFDADFLPHPSFLRESIKHFANENVGIVQTRWGHINQDYSLLTEVQAFQLNVHFTIEQMGRRAGKLLLQFNGTAGVWRRSCIDGAGGWEADTLTEDLDLSYRAQLRGWQVVYLEQHISPAELPAEMSGLKSQQFRWMKGGAENARKLLPQIWSSSLSFRQKLHASMHLLGSTVFLAVFTLGVLSVPLTFLINPLSIDASGMIYFMVSLLSILIIYYVANVQVAWQKENKLKMVLKFIFLFPIFLALSMGLSFHNSLAVIQGWIGKKTAFIRTPKFGIKRLGDQFKGKKYITAKFDKVTVGEGLLFLYFGSALLYSLHTGEQYFLPMHILLTMGYGLIFYFSVKHLRMK